MSSKQSKTILSKRELGNEWKDWNDLDTNKYEQVISRSSIFLSFFTVINTIYISALIYVSHLLNGISVIYLKPIFRQMIQWILNGTAVYIFITYLLFILTLIFKRPFAIYLKEKKFSNLFLAKNTLNIGLRLGINQDNLIHSMIKINNSMTKIIHSKPKDKSEIVILAPRCLTKELRNEIGQYMTEHDYQYHVVAGGTQARKVLKEKAPKGIIAIACERDLYAGIKDVPNHIPVYAITNQRPNGPCKDTIIDMQQLKEAIDFMTIRHPL